MAPSSVSTGRSKLHWRSCKDNDSFLKLLTEINTRNTHISPRKFLFFHLKRNHFLFFSEICVAWIEDLICYQEKSRLAYSPCGFYSLMLFLSLSLPKTLLLFSIIQFPYTSLRGIAIFMFSDSHT